MTTASRAVTFKLFIRKIEAKFVNPGIMATTRRKKKGII
jgi:hypothetical protein